MWDRSEIKQKAKARLKVNYWRMVLVAFIVTLITTGFNSARGISNTRNTRQSIQDINQYYNDDYYEDFDWDDEDGYDDYDYDTDDEDETVDYEGKQLRYEYDTPQTAENMTYSVVGGSDGPTSIFLAGRLGMGAATIGIIVLVVLIVLIFVFGLNFFLLNPLSVGGRRFFIKNMDEKAKVGNLGFAFDHNYLNVVKIMFLYDIKLVLWTLLLIIPGIVKGYEYRMVPYLLAENPELSSKEVFALSKRMMDGNKMDAFVFDISFFFWNLLGAITFGIVNIFFVNPYYEQANAFLYDTIKSQDEEIERRREETEYWRNLE